MGFLEERRARKWVAKPSRSPVFESNAILALRRVQGLQNRWYFLGNQNQKEKTQKKRTFAIICLIFSFKMGYQLRGNIFDLKIEKNAFFA